MSNPSSVPLTAPVAQRIPRTLQHHGHTRVDDYYWLRERDNPEVLAYLNAENAYTEQQMAPTAALQETLFQEMAARIQPDDWSVPQKMDSFYYYERFEPGKDYPLHCRKAGSLEAQEQILLDVNELALGQAFCAVTAVEPSSDHRTLAFAIDVIGRRKHDIRFRDLETGQFHPETIRQVTANFAWAEDGQTLFYTRQHPDTLRSYQIWRHHLGMDPAQDVLVFEEADPEFRCYTVKCKSRAYVFAISVQKTTSEFSYLDAHRPLGPFQVFLPRRAGLEMTPEHEGGHFYLRTNWQARNFRIVKAPIDQPDPQHWVDVIPHREDVFLNRFDLFRDFLVVEQRQNALPSLWIHPFSGQPGHQVDFDEPVYQVALQESHELDSNLMRFAYSSMTTPRSIYDYDLATRQKTLRKRQQVNPGFEPARYGTERVWATARDGALVPISLLYRKDFQRDGSRPVLLYGYGAYGHIQEAGFRAAVFSLVDRGFVYAIAHVRGGQEMGRAWYEDGKLLNKRNSFTDFVDCAEALVAQKIASPDLVFAEGGSAGGLLVGAAINLAPQLWKGVIAGVPFVDVLTSMLDADLPLTTIEYVEWGNPEEKAYYDYILSYSPYDQVEAKAYPHLFIEAGLHDSQVPYWEPAKWTAKLRALKTDPNRLLLHTNLEAGHGGASGRYKRLRLTALLYAFVLDLAGIST